MARNLKQCNAMNRLLKQNQANNKENKVVQKNNVINNVNHLKKLKITICSIIDIS